MDSEHRTKRKDVTKFFMLPDETQAAFSQQIQLSIYVTFLVCCSIKGGDLEQLMMNELLFLLTSIRRPSSLLLPI